jgi:hypothetical protein
LNVLWRLIGRARFIQSEFDERGGHRIHRPQGPHIGKSEVGVRDASKEGGQDRSAPRSNALQRAATTITRGGLPDRLAHVSGVDVAALMCKGGFKRTGKQENQAR